MKITAGTMHYRDLNEQIRATSDKDVVIDNCIGQRYIGNGLSEKNIVINGVPGNAVGAYLNGAKITINANAQDATGDTMNDGKIYIHGSSGDATGYAMRGGEIYVRDNAGYRAGIHMKCYKDKLPVLVIGGSAGCFLGEYLAGGIIVVLGINSQTEIPVGYFCGTGMHGGKIFIRCNEVPKDLPSQVIYNEATKEDMQQIEGYIDNYCVEFKQDKKKILDDKFYVLTANTKNPYKQLYVNN